MSYSLLGRVQGLFWAAALGEAIGIEAERQQRQATPANVEVVAPGRYLRTALDRRPGSSPLADVPAPHTVIWGTLAIKSARHLIETGGWDAHQLEPIPAFGADPTLSDPPDPPMPSATIPSKSYAATLHQSVPATQWAIALLPVILFYHDNQQTLRERLQHTLTVWRCPPTAKAGVLAIGYAIAQALTARLSPPTLLAATVDYLQWGTAEPEATMSELIEKLRQVQTLVHKGADLQIATAQLHDRSSDSATGAIAMAFYTFLSTPDVLEVSLRRAASTSSQAQLVCALTGALSGAYNSASGIPLHWRLSSAAPTNQLIWGVSVAALHQLAANLLAVWSGVYAPAVAIDYEVAIAAPNVIRPR